MLVAYGALIPPELLDRHEWLNVHPSLLPRWRGAAPVERAIMAGDDETGVSVDYLEDINSNESFFAKLRPDLANGDSGGRDIIIATDWMAKRYADLGYVQELDKANIPNAVNLEPDLQQVPFSRACGAPSSTRIAPSPSRGRAE